MAGNRLVKIIEGLFWTVLGLIAIGFVVDYVRGNRDRNTARAKYLAFVDRSAGINFDPEDLGPGIAALKSTLTVREGSFDGHQCQVESECDCYRYSDADTGTHLSCGANPDDPNPIGQWSLQAGEAFFRIHSLQVRHRFRGGVGGIHLGDVEDRARQILAARYAQEEHFRQVKADPPFNPGAEWGRLYMRNGLDLEGQPRYMVSWKLGTDSRISEMFVDDRSIEYRQKPR